MKSINTIGAAKFKEQCLALLDNLDKQGLVITKHGRPVALLTPYPKEPGALIGSLRDKIAVRGDILSTGLAWDADAQP
ncbi:MAG: type II toxin-antitoxin system prevent-host-death family antitoxin [Gammaproteobacteria bacterium]|nr:type II toxin-antitoxin system prevent-host-death family antitoxin [Gammaproteobacteria bacterium]MCY4283145.1 type II toxin-antitoxin system prevent-host-death family antitoxin [Gammaproteobacteria bacterium]